MGSETEYTSQFSVRDEVLELIPSKYRHFDNWNSGDFWLINGGRIYREYGDLIEYATPECRNANELLIHERAGERLVAEIAARLPEKSLLEEENANIYKRSGYDLAIDRDGDVLLGKMSAGHHENYTTHVTGVDSFQESALASYLATRPIWSGAGLVTTNGYAISQKGMAIKLDSDHQNATGHGNKMGFRHHIEDGRLEIRTGEGNMSDWQIVQKFAFTSLVLRLIETGKFPDQSLFRVNDASNFLKRMSETKRTRRMQLASEHQRSIARQGIKLAMDDPTIPKEEIHAAEEIIKATQQIDDYTKDPEALSSISDRIDWAAKLSYMTSRGLNSKDISTMNPKAIMYDLKWENIAPDGIARRWYKKFGSSVLDEPSIRRALHEPPSTRAKARSTAVKILDNNVHSISWSRVNGISENGTDVSIALRDPSSPNLDLK